MESESDLTHRLRDRIVTALHLERLHTGGRLPSIREVSRETGVDARIVTRAYRTLEAEGLVEVRGRSGVYVAEQERLGDELLSEMARWMAGVLTEAWKRMIKIPDLPEFVRRCTASVRLGCACVEANEDSITALCTELSESFGLDSRPVDLNTVPLYEPVEVEGLPAELREADLVVTTVFHAGVIRAIAEALKKPLVIVSSNPETGPEIERHLREGRLNAVIVDPRFGERLRSTYGGVYRERMRIVLAVDSQTIAELDPSEPVLLTEAARHRLGEMSRFTLVPHTPCISARSARELAEILIRLNIEAQRR
ncbi:MAG: GntR family transcriptional regulator [Gemmatimonadetes bacterium]|jgi:DNA-binding transcriptional regulator YhcF (GntR family)|nr:GntR family transcriptional regulator [Gemmatimonadota bacterium]